MNEKLKEISELCTNALLTDGEHHKQWYLEKILSIANGKSIEKNRESAIDIGYDMEEGIPP